MKEHDRVRDLLKSSANLEFYETMPLVEFQGTLQQLDNALRADSASAGRGLFDYFAGLGAQGNPIAVGMATRLNRTVIDSLLVSPHAKRILPRTSSSHGK